MMTNSNSEAVDKEERRLIAAQLSDDVVVSPVGTYTFERGLDAAGVGLYQWLLLIYVGFAWVCDAMEMMLLSFLAPAADCEWDLSPAQKGAITSVVFVGMFFGAYMFGMLADSEGRKTGFLATAVFTVIWGFASAASPNYPLLLLFRMLVGIGLGGVAVAFSLFLEFVPTAMRGRFAILLQGFWTVGALFEAGIAWAVLPTLGWRYLLAISSIPFVILLVFFPFLSESPRYLAMRGKTMKAEKILERIARWNGTTLPNGKLTSPKASNMETGLKGTRYHAKKVTKGLFSGTQELLSDTLRRTTLLLLLVWFVNALVYYGLVLLTTELQSKENQKCDGDHFDLEKDQYFEIFVDTIAEFVGFSIAYFTIDSLGRRTSLTVFMGVCSMAMWPLVLSNNDIYQTTFLFIGRASIVGSFNVIYVYTPELFPTDVRAFGLGICTALSRLGGLVAPLFAVQLVDQGLSTIVELLFAALCIAGAVASSWIPIETKGRELQDKVEVEMANVQSTARIPSDEEIQPL